MRLAPSTAVLAAFAALVFACAPPKASEPETTAVYDKPPAAAPAPVTRVSVSEPAGETLGVSSPPAEEPAAPAPAAPAPTSEPNAAAIAPEGPAATTASPVVAPASAPPAKPPAAPPPAK